MVAGRGLRLLLVALATLPLAATAWLAPRPLPASAWSLLPTRLRARHVVGVRHSEPRMSLCSPLGLELGALWSLSTLGSFYHRAQTCFPRTTCVTQGCLLSVIGDAISQAISRRQDPAEPGDKPDTYCWKRFMIAALAGCVFDGLAVPLWYSYLHAVVPGGMRLRGLVLTIIDLALLSTCGNFCNMMFRNLLAGGSLLEAWRETKSKILAVIIVDLRIFPAYDILMFTYVPRHAQALATALVCCMWNCYLSSMTASAAHPKHLHAMSPGL